MNDEEFAIKMALRANACRVRVEQLQSDLNKAKLILRAAQECCPHRMKKIHERATAETSEWIECLDCGAEVNE